MSYNIFGDLFHISQKNHLLVAADHFFIFINVSETMELSGWMNIILMVIKIN